MVCPAFLGAGRITIGDVHYAIGNVHGIDTELRHALKHALMDLAQAPPEGGGMSDLLH